MSRMVRETQVSGLRERHWFAQLLLRQLIERTRQGAPRGEALALRGAVIFHLYSALVGLARNAASNYGVADANNLVALSAISDCFSRQDKTAPEMALIDDARLDRGDPIFWLEGEVMAAHGASGLARRPTPPAGEGVLGIVAEDPYALLAEGDLERLQQALTRVQGLLEQAAVYMEEW